MTSRAEIGTWFDAGVAEGATHMAVFCDTFDWSDYPVFLDAAEVDVRAEIAKKDGHNMQQLMEVYKLDLDKEIQLAERRAHHI